MKNKVKTLALIAHDNKKHDLVNWAIAHKELLQKYKLCGTGTTAKLIAEATGLEVKGYLSGPLGGDLQIGAKMSEKAIDKVIFFWDPSDKVQHKGEGQPTPTLAGVRRDGRGVKTAENMVRAWCLEAFRALLLTAVPRVGSGGTWKQGGQ